MTESPIAEKKTSREEILDLLIEVVRDNINEDKIVIPVSRMAYHFYSKKNKDISDQTIRRYGFNPNGYFIAEYPDIFDWHKKTRDKRGLIINIQEFIIEFKEHYSDEKIEEKLQSDESENEDQ